MLSSMSSHSACFDLNSLILDVSQKKVWEHLQKKLVVEEESWQIENMTDIAAVDREKYLSSI